MKFERFKKQDEEGQSLPSRERGLKFNWIDITSESDLVAPFAGAWIEIVMDAELRAKVSRRSLRGSVD